MHRLSTCVERVRRAAGLMAALALALAGTGCQDAPAAKGLELHFAPPAVAVTAGKTATLQVTVARQPGSPGAITVELVGLPAGVTASTLVIPAGGATGQLTLAAAWTTAVTPTVDVLVQVTDGETLRQGTVAVTVVPGIELPPEVSGGQASGGPSAAGEAQNHATAGEAATGTTSASGAVEVQSGFSLSAITGN